MEPPRDDGGSSSSSRKKQSNDKAAVDAFMAARNRIPLSQLPPTTASTLAGMAAEIDMVQQHYAEMQSNYDQVLAALWRSQESIRNGEAEMRTQAQRISSHENQINAQKAQINNQNARIDAQDAVIDALAADAASQAAKMQELERKFAEPTAGASGGESSPDPFVDDGTPPIPRAPIGPSALATGRMAAGVVNYNYYTYNAAPSTVPRRQISLPQEDRTPPRQLQTYVAPQTVPAKFPVQSVGQLVGNTFDRTEEAIIRQCSMPFTVQARRTDHRVHKLINDVAELTGDNRVAMELLEDHTVHLYPVIGLVNKYLVNTVFDVPFITDFECPYNDEYLAKWQQLLSVTNYGADWTLRYNIRNEMIALVEHIVKVPGFWKWMDRRADEITNEICQLVDVLLARSRVTPGRPDPAAFQHFRVGVNQALRLCIRMRSEPPNYEFLFLPSGTAWEGSSMVQRNPEMRYKVFNESGDWMVRTTIAPLVRQRYIAKEGPKPETVIHKPIVLISKKVQKLQKR